MENEHDLFSFVTFLKSVLCAMYHTTYNIQHALQRLLQGCSCGGKVSYIKHTNILPDTTSRREREAREQMLRAEPLGTG